MNTVIPEIKLAINSTVGTDEFLPLNEIIGQEFTSFKNGLIFIGSHDVLSSLHPSSSSSSSIAGTFTPKLNGNILIFGEVYNPSTTSVRRIEIWVNNGTRQIIWINRDSVGSFEIPIEVTANTSYEIHISKPDGNVLFQGNPKIGGTIIYSNLYTMTF